MLGFAQGDASSWLPQDPVCRFRKIFRRKIRLCGPFRGMPGQSPLAISGAHQDASRANVAGQLDVAVAVTYDERPRQIERVFACSTFQQAGPGLAAIAMV